MVSILGVGIEIAVPSALAISQILNDLDLSLKAVPDFFGGLIDFRVSMNRIQQFLNCEEADVAAIQKYESEKIVKKYGISLQINDSSFTWGYSQSEIHKLAEENHIKEVLNPEAEEEIKNKGND